MAKHPSAPYARKLKYIATPEITNAYFVELAARSLKNTSSQNGRTAICQRRGWGNTIPFAGFETQPIANTTSSSV
jgi:hypothetical protein